MSGRIAMLSLHTSPLAQPGVGDGGGMNVYVCALARSLARAGVECDVFTRAERPGQPTVVPLERGARVIHVRAGPPRPVPKHDLPGLVDEMVEAVGAVVSPGTAYRAVHAHYWVSGAVGHRLKHELGLPLVATFHTLERVKVLAGVFDDHPARAQIEADVIRCADAVVVSTDEERADVVRHYDAEPERVETVAPGVDRTLFATGDRVRARRRLHLPDVPTVLYVGRLQPLKGVDVAVRSFAALQERRAQLVVVGGPSGVDGDNELARLIALAAQLGVGDRVRFVPPVPHRQLVDYYRAADLCVVPSRTESFGLVALEAAACGRPVVAADVGGLRALVEHGRTGYLVGTRDPDDYAQHVDELLARDDLRSRMGADATARAAGYAWSMAAARLRRLYGDLSARALVECT